MSAPVLTPLPAPTPNEGLLAAVEREVAEFGFAGASMRRIARRAGLRNVASVQYHFGGLEHAVESVFSWRARAIDEARGDLIRTLGGSPTASLDGWIGVVVRPVAAFIRGECPRETWYLRFTQAAVRGIGHDQIERSAMVAPNYAIAFARLWGMTTHLPEAARRRRLRLAARIYLGALADLEVSLAEVARKPDKLALIDEAEEDLLASLHGVLAAPERIP